MSAEDQEGGARSAVPPLEVGQTERGFGRGEFRDRYGSRCSLQESSLGSEAAIWLGVDIDFNGKETTRMHLTQAMVAALLPALQRFVETGFLR